MTGDQLKLDVKVDVVCHWVEYKVRKRRFGLWVVGKDWEGAYFSNQEKAWEFHKLLKKESE